MIAQLSEGDIHAIEARYHPDCLCKYYSRASQLENQSQETYQNSVTYDIVMTEVINFMKKSIKKHNGAPVFVLSKLKKMFKTAYQRYSGESTDPQSTRFKEELISKMPGLQAHKKGKQII